MARISNSGDLFEMRRLEGLSNTIFGVAMVLLAYRFPAAQFPSGTPVWSTIWAAYHAQIVALVLSFIVAGMFWLSHQRRLAYAPLASRWVVYCNLLFLLSVIALPITTGLYATYSDARDVVVLYSGHLAVISCLNTILGLLASLPRGQPERVVGSIFATIIFIAATFVASISSQMYTVPLILCSAFAAPVIDTIMAARKNYDRG
jgi:TMEM175 potassium channel family protein